METLKVFDNPIPIMHNSNFTVREFWLPCQQEFEVYTCIVKALDFIRNYYKIRWSITSSYRPLDDPKGPEAHRINPPAIDSRCTDKTLWPEICRKIRSELVMWQTSPLVKGILETGTNVIIIENVTLHMQYRTTNLHTTKEYGKIYLGEWTPEKGNPRGINIAYSKNT